jgi:four helix bundle protein
MFAFEELIVWQRSIVFANAMFDLADELPKRYQFSLGEQLRRASLSIPTNIAEGSGRSGGKEQGYFYGVARGSVYEVVSLLVMVEKRGNLAADGYERYHKEADEIAAMLTGLARATKRQ